MEVFKPGDQLGFQLESAYEIGLVGKIWQDDLYGNLPANRGLPGSVDGAVTASAKPLQKVVTFNCLPREILHRCASRNRDLIISAFYGRSFCDGTENV